MEPNQPSNSTELTGAPTPQQIHEAKEMWAAFDAMQPSPPDLSSAARAALKDLEAEIANAGGVTAAVAKAPFLEAPAVASAGETKNGTEEERVLLINEYGMLKSAMTYVRWLEFKFEVDSQMPFGDLRMKIADKFVEITRRMQEVGLTKEHMLTEMRKNNPTAGYGENVKPIKLLVDMTHAELVTERQQLDHLMQLASIGTHAEEVGLGMPPEEFRTYAADRIEAIDTLLSESDPPKL